MKKRAVMHRDFNNVVIRLLKSDFANQLIKEGSSEFLPAGTLLKAKNGNDLREKSDYMLPISAGTKADGVLVHDVEFRGFETDVKGTVAIEGIVYLDKLIEVGKEHKTPLTVTKTELPEKVTYVYKDRK